MTPMKDRWVVWLWQGARWTISAGRHQNRWTAVIQQQWWEYVEGVPAVIIAPASISLSPPPQDQVEQLTMTRAAGVPGGG